MFRRFIIVVMVLMLFMAAGCRPKEKLDSRLIRFIDRLSKDNIVRSPLISLDPTEETQDRFYPGQSFPLPETVTGENLFGIKRKLKTGGAERNILYSPVESEYKYSLPRLKDAILEFGVGIVRKEEVENQSPPNEKNGVNFYIKLENKDRKRIIFQKYLSLPINTEDKLIFSRQKVELPETGKDILISFITEGSAADFPFWSNPVIRTRQDQRFKVIMISIDTLRADHLSCYGYNKPTSPHIDVLADDSALFTNTYAASPWTLPSHISLFTSLYGVHHQVYDDQDKMDPELITMAEVMRANSYNTTAFTGGGFVSAIYGFSKGFDSYYEGEGGVFHQDSAERVFNVVSDWLDNSYDHDFFLFIHTYQPHSPYACPMPYKVMFLDEDAKWGNVDLIQHLGGKDKIFKPLPDAENRNIQALYDGEIRYTDEKLIGPLVEKLKNLQIYDNTLIILTSDHGEEFYDHSGWGHGHSLYDESLKVPLIIKFPQSEHQGNRCEYIVSLVDILPTVMDKLELEYSNLNIDGKSLLPLLQGKEKRDRGFFADIGDDVLRSHIPKKTAANRGRKKLILNKTFHDDDFSFFLFPPPGNYMVEMYDLAEDPGETTNVSEKHALLAREVLEWFEELSTNAKKRNVGKLVMDDKLKEQLKALGYIR